MRSRWEVVATSASPWLCSCLHQRLDIFPVSSSTAIAVALCRGKPERQLCRSWMASTDVMCDALGGGVVPPKSRRDLHRGDAGPDVANLQFNLNQVGYLTADGSFGVQTESALDVAEFLMRRGWSSAAWRIRERCRRESMSGRTCRTSANELHPIQWIRQARRTVTSCRVGSLLRRGQAAAARAVARGISQTH
jgi:hypothetical protein